MGGRNSDSELVIISLPPERPGIPGARLRCSKPRDVRCSTKTLEIDRSLLPGSVHPDNSRSIATNKGFDRSAIPSKAAHEEILHRAYSIWECSGRPEHCEMDHWLKAEDEVLAEAQSFASEVRR